MKLKKNKIFAIKTSSAYGLKHVILLQLCTMAWNNIVIISSEILTERKIFAIVCAHCYYKFVSFSLYCLKIVNALYLDIFISVSNLYLYLLFSFFATIGPYFGGTGWNLRVELKPSSVVKEKFSWYFQVGRFNDWMNQWQLMKKIFWVSHSQSLHDQDGNISEKQIQNLFIVKNAF